MKYKTFFAYPRVSEERPESIADVVARTPYFDRIIQRVAGDVEQFVVLVPAMTPAPTVISRSRESSFEVDQTATQQHKIGSLDQAGVDWSQASFM